MRTKMASTPLTTSAARAGRATPGLAAALALGLGLGLAAGCAGDRPEGLTPTVRAGGPVVVWDVRAKPLPEVPLPNDAATRIDDTSPTGRRINVSMIAPTALERDLREKANQLEGFGVYMPITVRFDAPLDLLNLIERHGTYDDPTDDAVYLVDVTPGSPSFGQRQPIDIGGGAFPLTLEKTDAYFENDVQDEAVNVLFSMHAEDANCDGVLDPAEDIDHDGVLDVPNVRPDFEWPEDLDCDGELDPGEDIDCDGQLDANPAVFEGIEPACDGQPLSGLARDNLHRLLADAQLTFYERETDTLMIRPILPLRGHTTYAVVLTKRLVGEGGAPVESPFPWTSPATQQHQLAPLMDALPGLGLGPEDIAFAWAYTTSSPTAEMEAIRRGLYGAGTLSWLAEQFPVEAFELDRLRDDPESDQPYFVTAEELAPVFDAMAAVGLGVSVNVADIEGVIIGSFDSPNFLVDRDGIATEGNPADDDESFELDITTGEAVVGPSRVSFWCFLPREPASDPPPVQIYGHGYTGGRFDAILAMSWGARFGLTVCALDAFGHGMNRDGDALYEFAGQIKPIRQLASEFFGDAFGLGSLAEAILSGRDRDLDNDGLADSGGDFWTADAFHTRDVVRQSVVDHIQFIRMLRSFDGQRVGRQDTDGDGQPNLLGDVDGDGQVDLGGPDATYSMWGISLGGILTGVLAGIEPALDAAAPVAGGAGLVDVGLRSRQPGVPEAVFMPLLGPMIVAEPDPEGPEGATELAFVVNDVNDEGRYVFYRTMAIRPGYTVALDNLVNGERDQVHVPASGEFRLSVAADAMTAMEKRHLLGDAVVEVVDITDPEQLGRLEGQGDLSDTPLLPVRAAPYDPLEIADALVLSVYDERGERVETIDSFGVEVDFQGARHAIGSPLVALAKGFGFSRNSPNIRRFTTIASMILQAGDPVGYARHYALEPLDVSDYDPGVEPGVNTLVIPTIGDMNVPINAGIMNAVAAGIVEHEAPDPRYGTSQLRLLIDSATHEGIERLGRHEMEVMVDTDGDCEHETAERHRGLFDVDDLDQGLSQFVAPSPDQPLRATLKTEAGVSGMRIPYLTYEGQHGFYFPDSCLAFDINTYMLNLVGWYSLTGGTDLPDDICLESETCDFLPWNKSP